MTNIKESIVRGKKLLTCHSEPREFRGAKNLSFVGETTERPFADAQGDSISGTFSPRTSIVPPMLL